MPGLCSGNLCFIFIFDGFSYLGWICKKWLWHRTLTLSGPNSKHWNLDFLIGQDLAVLTCTFCVYCNKLLQFICMGVFRHIKMFSEYLGLWIRMGFEYLDNMNFFLRCYNFFFLQSWHRILKFTIQFIIWTERARESTFSEGHVQGKMVKVNIQVDFAI